MKDSISPFIKIFFVTLIILITFPTHLLAYTSNSMHFHQLKMILIYNQVILYSLRAQFYLVFGHSSIALDHDTVLQIEGPGDKPITESFHSFKQRFGEGKDDWIKIYRCSMPGAEREPLNGLKNTIKIQIRHI